MFRHKTVKQIKAITLSTLAVIVPVYKTEKTLEKCIKSILNQSYSDMELWLVDDGSPDHCSEICDKWAATESRIKVIHKPNGGLSDARNAALDQISSPLVMFADSDDYLAPNTIGQLMQYMSQHPECDILEFGVEYIGSQRNRLSFDDHQYTSARSYWLNAVVWEHSYMWNKVFRSKLFADKRFAKGRLFEDLLLLPDILLDNPQVHTTCQGCYCYTWNDNGISANISTSNIKQLLFAEQEAKRKMQTSLFDRNGWKLYYKMLCRQIDIYRLSGEIILHWPFVRLICWVHKHFKHHK